MNEVVTPVEIFCCYAHEDEAWRQKLETHLNVLKRLGLISLWHDRLIVPGTDWARTIDAHLEVASVVLLLVSSDFFLSDYCYGIEMKRAMERQETGEALVIPILVRPVDWNSAPFAHLQVLPTDARPLSTWQDEETALTDVAAGIRSAIADVVRLSVSAQRAALPVIWNIPYSRNPFFLGRDAELVQVRSHLQGGQATALSQPQAIGGLGGIGKTQLALEYAYRYHQHYQVVLWARAESTEALVSSYIALALLLRLPESEASEQEITIQAVKRWLQTHHDWLLILDNADELALLSDFLPPSLGGHMLLTTRAIATGRLARRLEVKTLQPDLGALFLLRRAVLLPPEATLEQASQEEQELALQISSELGGLPLALDQAGAYLEETGTSLFNYWQIYQQHRADLLQQRRGLVPDHPAPVATTWSLSFEKVTEKNLATADLLRLCAFLSPDAIPEELLTVGASCLGPVLALVAADAFLLNRAIEALQAYSLIRRDPKEKTLSIHRLVQAVLQDTMKETEKHLWAERAILAISMVFPHAEHATRSQCERLLPQALKAAEVIEQYQIISDEAGRLLYEAASYLSTCGRYASAEALFLQAKAIWKQLFGEEHSSVVNLLAGLATLYEKWGKYAESETLFLRVRDIWELQFGPNHPSVSDALYGLAGLYREQGKYTQAEPLFLRAQRIREQHFGEEHPSVGKILSGLALLYRSQGKHEEAKKLCQHALQIWEQQPDPKHPDMTYPPLNVLAGLYRTEHNYEKAEELLQRALRIWEQQPGLAHPDLAYPLNSLAVLYREQGKYAEAEELLQRALLIREQLGPEHPYVAYSLSGLATLYYEQRKYDKAKSFYLRALHIWKQAQLPEHPRTAEIMYDLAELQEKQGNSNEARTWYTRALAIREQAFGVRHQKTTEIRQRLIALLHAIGQHQEATRLEAIQLE